MKDQSRIVNKLLSENIQPLLTSGTPNAATLYTVSEKIKRKMNNWVDSTRIEDIRKASLLRKPMHSQHAKDMMVRHIDNISNLERLESILETIEEGKHRSAWNLIFS